MLEIITLHVAQEMKRLRIVSLSMELDKRMKNKGYIHWLLSTLVLMAVAQILLLSINVPSMERKVYIELRSHFQNDFYKQNLATTVNKSIGNARYHGEVEHLLLRHTPQSCLRI